MTDRRPEDALRGLLRQGDPAADGHDPDRSTIARSKACVLSEVRDSRRVHWLPLVAAATAILIAALVLVPAANDKADSPSNQPEHLQRAASGAPADTGSPDLSKTQQIQFAAEGGTRIIWVVAPSLTL